MREPPSDRHPRASRADDAAEVLDARARGRRRRASSPSRRRRRRRDALALAERHDGVYAVPRHPPARGRRRRRATLDELRELLGHPKAVAVGETGLDYFRDYAPHDAQQRLFEAQLALARELGKPVVIHTRAADDDTLARARRLRRHRDPALLLVAARCSSRRSSAAGTSRSPATSPTRRRPSCARPRAASRPTACSPRPTARTSRRSRSAASRNEPAYVVHTLAALAEARGEDAGRARRADRRERDGRVRAVSVAPKKELGQHFLVDENILGVIGRLAELDADDVVLEVGPGLGVLTRFLADRVAHVHAVELDRSLEPHLARHRRARRSTGATRSPSTSRRSSRRRRSSSRTCPTTSRRRSSSRASTASPQLELWCVMVQREVADRFFAAPGTKAYGAVSVLVQLATERTGLPPGLARGVPAAAERRLGARRVPPHRAGVPGRREAASSTASFAHRRKTLANALALAGVASREQAVAALAAIGRDAGGPGRGARAARSSSRSRRRSR